MFRKKLFSRKTILTIVSMEVHRKDKKNMKTKKNGFSHEKMFLHKKLIKIASTGSLKKTMKE